MGNSPDGMVQPLTGKYIYCCDLQQITSETIYLNTYFTCECKSLESRSRDTFISRGFGVLNMVRLSLHLALK